MKIVISIKKNFKRFWAEAKKFIRLLPNTYRNKLERMSLVIVA